MTHMDEVDRRIFLLRMSTDECSIIDWCNACLRLSHSGPHAPDWVEEWIQAHIDRVVVHGETVVHGSGTPGSEADAVSLDHTAELRVAVSIKRAIEVVSSGYRIVGVNSDDGRVWELRLYSNEGIAELYRSPRSTDVYRMHSQILALQAAMYYVSRNDLGEYVDVMMLQTFCMTRLGANAAEIVREALQAARRSIVESADLSLSNG